VRDDRFLHFLHIFFTFFFLSAFFFLLFFSASVFFFFSVNAVVTRVSRPPVPCTRVNRADATPNANAPLRLSVFLVPGVAAAAAAATAAQSCGDHSYASRPCEYACDYARESRGHLSERHLTSAKAV